MLKIEEDRLHVPKNATQNNRQKATKLENALSKKTAGLRTD